MFTRSLARVREPWANLLSLQEEVDQLFSALPGPRLFGDPGYLPAIDLLKDKDTVIVHADLPGMKREDIQLTVLGDRLVLSGTKKSGSETDEGQVHTRERYFGTFERTIHLPDPVDADRVSATFVDGVLTITCPVSEAARPRQIAVTVK